MAIVISLILFLVQRINRSIVKHQPNLLFLRRAILMMHFVLALHFSGSVHMKIGTASAGLDGLLYCDFVFDGGLLMVDILV